MNPRVCRACGEAILATGNTRSRNPNLCASCSSLLDGMGEEFPDPGGCPPGDRLIEESVAAEHKLVSD